MTRKVAVLTGTRADYGLLRGLLRALDASPDVELQLIVTGTHLSQRFGSTIAEIERDGFDIAATVPIWSDRDSRIAVAEDVGLALPEYVRVLSRLSPDVLVILGDRLEAFAAASAATILSLPIAHIHGGEVTEGAMDDALRHAITKMSYLHFASTAAHARRVIQLGEDPQRVFFHGAPIVDALAGIELMPPALVETTFDVRLKPPVALVTFHPAVLDVAAPETLVAEMLDALLAVEGLHVVVTGSNSDIGTDDVRGRIAAFASQNPQRVDFVESFGQRGYLSAMAAASVVVGNSSSTVLEAPVLGVPSVLIGDRQKGRPLATSVATPAPVSDAISDAVRRAIDESGDRVPTDIFGEPGFATRTAQTLTLAALPKPPRKTFHDLDTGDDHGC